jgi:hypothetical protein
MEEERERETERCDAIHEAVIIDHHLTTNIVRPPAAVYVLSHTRQKKEINKIKKKIKRDQNNQK